MAIEVRIPTILRTVHRRREGRRGQRATPSPTLIADLETPAPRASRTRIVDGGELHRFVNVYLNDEDVRFLGGLDTKLADGDSVTDPARRRRRLTPWAGPDAVRLACSAVGRATPRWSACRGCRPSRRRPALGQARGPQPDRLDQGPRRRCA